MSDISKGRYFIAALGIFMLAACNQAKSPETVQEDVSHAEVSGGKEVARAEQKEANTDSRQDNKVAAAVDSAASTEVDAAVNTALAQADADKKVALAKCEALGGDQQSACRREAKAQYDLAKARAKEIKSAAAN